MSALSDICRRLRKSDLHHHSSPDIAEQLRSETSRRLIGIIFEKLFRDRIAECTGRRDMAVSYNWHTVFEENEPAYWFRLLRKSGDWNECDRELAKRLHGIRTGEKKSPARVFSVILNEEIGEMQGREQKNNGKWLKERPILDDLLQELAHRPRHEPRSMNVSSDDKQKRAIAHICGRFDHAELFELSVGRRFINCHLGSHFSGDASDLDAFVLAENGSLNYIEFKRKYPSRSGDFGIDRGHIRIMRALETVGIGYLHLILVGPFWDKNSFPLDWLEDNSLNHRWAWIAGCLDSEAFASGKLLRTYGSDSGQRAMEREQLVIPWDRLKLLSNGLMLDGPADERLAHFLGSNTTERLQEIDFRKLKQLTIGTP